MSTPMPSFSNSGGGSQILSSDGLFVSLYIDALRALQSTWLQSEQVIDVGHFNLQLDFCIRLLPDDAVIADIQAERMRLASIYKAAGLDHPEVRASLVAVTAIVKFLGQNFGLIHQDIIGPGTDDEFVVIPDIPVLIAEMVDVKE